MEGFGGFDDDFPVDQFADLSTFSSPDVVASFVSPSTSSHEKKSSKISSKTEIPKSATHTVEKMPVFDVEKDNPSPLIQQIASVLVARLYDVALQLRDDVDQRLVRNALHARHDLSTFVSMVSKHVEFTVSQFSQRFADEKKKDLAMLWTQYSLYKRTKPKDNMSKRQFSLLTTHWLHVLCTIETAAVNRSYETVEEKDNVTDGERRGSKSFFGFGSKSKDKPAAVPLRLNKDVLQEFHHLILFGASTLSNDVDLVVDAVWERLYVHDAATGLNPRGDETAPEGCQSKFVLNFIPAFPNLKTRYGVQTERRSQLPTLELHYEKMLQNKHAADRQRAYTEHLEKTGII